MLITTTNSIEGKTINNYHGLVRASVILGTNMLSDITASFTDFFGGRSGTYEKKIQQIYEEVIEQLEVNAYTKGANCIIGLKLDIDEISGKNTQMFMVTAYGTAVNVGQTGPVGTNVDTAIINSRMMENKVRGRILMKESPDTIFNSEEHVSFIGNSGLEELADITMNTLRKFSNKEARINAGVDESAKKLSLLSNYFRNADWSKVKDRIYSEFYKTDEYSYLEMLRNVIITNQQVDFDICVSMMKSDSITAAKTGLH